MMCFKCIYTQDIPYVSYFPLLILPFFVCVVFALVDLEARPPAVAVIGFGGIADRPAVRAGADWFVYALSDIEVLVTAAVGNAGTDVGSKCEAAGAGERAGAAGDVDAETVV
jgi:hypothetical protein